MSEEISVGLSVFVQHGRQQEAADFYTAAFGAQQGEVHHHDGELMAVEMLFGSTPVAVVGSNPKREADPALGGPFFPKAPGAVSTVLRLTVGNLGEVFSAAVAAGATFRDEIGPDSTGSRSASVFDPFGHLWGLTERKAKASRLAA